MTWLAVGSGVIAIAALAFAVYAGWSARSDAKDWANQLVAAGKLQVATERNQLTAERDRDTQKERADKAEAELADATAQLKSTQAALSKAQEKDAANAAKVVENAPDPLAAFNDELRTEAGASVPDAADASAGHGDQGKPAV